VPVYLQWLILGMVPAVSILLVFFVWWQHRLQLQQQQLLSVQIEQMQQQLQSGLAEIAELRSGVVGVGRRTVKLEQFQQTLQQQQQAIAAELEQISEHQQQIQLFDPESKLYSRAMKMVQLGAGLDEIIRECELPRAEAELLISLHRQQQG
jgi:hypothetical protein